MIESNYQLGTWITLNNYSIVEIVAELSFDWICIDLEHSVIDYDEMQQLILVIQGKNKLAYVRVGENNTRIIKRVLDAGADGIIIPFINTKEDAIHAISSVKYPPEGTRGVGLARAQGYGFNFQRYKDELSKQVKIIVQIEHISAISNLNSILQLDGIDGTFIGPFDLSGSLGQPGEFNSLLFNNAIEQYETISKCYNKLMGIHIIEPDYRLVIEQIQKGYNFIAFSLDILFLGTIIRQELNNLNRAITNLRQS